MVRRRVAGPVYAQKGMTTEIFMSVGGAIEFMYLQRFQRNISMNVTNKSVSKMVIPPKNVQVGLCSSTCVEEL